MDSIDHDKPADVLVESAQTLGFGISIFGFTDVFLVTGLVGFVVYWIFLRQTKQSMFDGRTLRPVASTNNLKALSDTGLVGKMKNTGRNIVAFYGSQTGTAEEFATRLAKEANRYGMKAMVADPEECDLDDLAKLNVIENSMAIFCMATYGEGDPTDNAQEFYQWLQNTDINLEGLQYAVFALGNKTYEHYNDMGKYVDTRLEELGATRVYELGLGDDDANIEDDFITWKERFWGAVCEHFNVVKSGEDISFRQYQLIVHDDIAEEKVYTGEVARLNSFSAQKPPFDMKNPYLAPVTMNRELYKGERSCMHLEFDLSGSKIRYESGDHVAVYPLNNPETVLKIGNLLDVNLDQVITLRNLDEDSTKKHPFPCPCSYRTALLHYVDITCLPRTHVLKELSEYASNEDEKQKLKLMGAPSAEGKALYNEFILKNCRSILHILEDFPSLKPPLDHVIELLPRLQCRYYSISSSPKVHPQSIHVTAVLIDYKTPTNRDVRGVATGWLKGKKTENGYPPPTVPVFVRRSQFRLPSKPQIPIIMIGPGTGLAPFRGFIQERHLSKQEGKPVGETILYFGCRKKTEDFLYEDELNMYLDAGTLTKIYLAFSRDQKDKIYVTHLLQQNRQEIWNIIEHNGHIYVCGDARSMAKDVHNIIVDIIHVEGQKSKAEAEAFLKRMESQRKYSCDVWS